MNERLAHLCAVHGIEPSYTGLDGVTREVPEHTLFALAETFDIAHAAPQPPAGIDAVRTESSPSRCYIPDELAYGRVWGITCQLGALTSARNAGIGDFADLLALCRLAAAEGADFVGVNPLHALFWSDPGKVSPFFPSNRRFLNPLYIALDWIEGFDGLSDDERPDAENARRGECVDNRAVMRLKDKVLRRLFDRFPSSDGDLADFRAFCEDEGDALTAHAVFEAISAAMAAEGRGASPHEWPDALRRHDSPEVSAFTTNNAAAVDYHRWLQWLARRQLANVQREARAAGMRIGLYLDFAVGAAPDGSAAWSDPTITVPGVSIGAPPDFFNTSGQDWGLAPLSPVALAVLDGEPFARDFAAVARFAGAVRIDHAMSLARLWLIPRGAPATDGAYVRYPLSALLRRIAEVSHATGTLVIGEDLGVVPVGFRELMHDRALHRYMIFFFEGDGNGYADPARWPADSLACVTTHDMPTFARWWRGGDLEIREALGFLSGEEATAARENRARERHALLSSLHLSEDEARDALRLSTALYTRLCSAPSRLAALQIEDALGLDTQVNIPGTVAEYPNWVQRIPVAIEKLADDPPFRAHMAAMRQARPR